MDRLKLTPASNEDAPFNIIMIGAGNIMFGSDEGPWNHSFRFEHKLQTRLRVVALVDPSIARSNAVLQQKRATFVELAYRDTVPVKTIDEFLEQMRPDQKPNAIIIGSPPAYRGSDLPGADIELKLIKYFPGAALFVEKPVATGPVERSLKVAKAIKESGAVCSVGYMLRYLKAVQEMKRIIEDNDLHVMATTARYICAYEKIAKPDWWNKSLTCGPIVEQATHFCDLSRYFGGDVDIPSVQAHSLEFYEEAGGLSKIPIDESAIKPVDRIPRVTSATWKYENGAVGTLTHVVALQGASYACELEVYADGFLLKLIDPYNAPELRVRRPGGEDEVVYKFSDDDPFFSEASNFIDVVEQKNYASEEVNILSSYEDACKTYEFTWAIRNASEKTRKLPPGGL